MEKIVASSARDREKIGHIDLESVETSIRGSMYSMGAKVLEELINSDGGDYMGRIIEQDKGESYEFKEYRNKDVLTVLGNINLKRAYYYNEKVGTGYFPKDKDLDIEGSSFSPGIRRIMARVGAYRPYELGHMDIKEISGIDVDTKAIDRWSNIIGNQVDNFNKKEFSAVMLKNVIPINKIPIMYICADGTGVPMVKTELANREGKNGIAKTREAKLGCIFTQTTVDEEGRPVRDENSTTYVGAIETAEEFSCRINAEAVRRQINRAEKVCVIGDGAPWIWNIANDRFPGAIQIIDLFHAREHYWNVAKVAFKGNKRREKDWTRRRKEDLNNGKPEKVICAISKLIPLNTEEDEFFNKEMNYFEKNKGRMRYNEFRKQGLFVGSGVLEAGCRTVVGQRLKQSGMHWTVPSANNIISLRCCLLSNQWEDFWESRAYA